MTQKTPAQLRADAEEALRELGQRRIRLLAELETVDADLRPLIAEARRMEVSLRKITDLTAVAPNTIRAWGRQEGE
ncbi:hypothetical protein ABZ957_09580 [Streptomyces sp. NPDC046316]|uniref:hypothetical protein n=1 Tax=unclassified Streptomyces TaxID=2593676 RepID=UPI0033CDE66F